ncbi:MAG: Septin-domain-containing protein [Linnemannia gamsii]|nr:MAG: Septin-domain-containing protein [Linnemannia gamsii]
MTHPDMTIDPKASATNATALRFLLLGDVGVGKSAFLNTFISSLVNVQTNEDLEECISAPTPNQPSFDLTAFSLPATRVTTAPVLMPGEDSQESFITDRLDLLPPKVQIPARDVSFITLPGYSSTVNPSTTLTLTDDYLNHHLRTVTSIFSHSISTAQLAWFLITGSQVHALPTCAFYFVLYELKPIDIIYMKLIHERVNLVPVITKSDSLSQRELWILKRRMIRQLKLHGIQFHTFGLGMETVERMAEQRQWGAPPFAVSSRLDANGQLLQSELPQLINMCLYDRFRQSQEEAAQKVIAWKSAFPVLDSPGLASVEHIWSTQTFEIGGVIAQEQLSRQIPLPFEDTRPTEIVQTTLPPPPENFIVESSGYSSLGSASATSPDASFSHVIGTPIPEDGYISPDLFQTQPLVPVNGAFLPLAAIAPESSATASQIRMSLIHQSTGMAVDSSDRPNVIMDENTVNTVHTQVGSFLDAYGQPIRETSIKVPIPSSTTNSIPPNG